MATLVIKQGYRCRVSFTMSVSLWQLYQENLKAAQKAGGTINFNDEFEVWFRHQNKDAKLKLAAHCAAAEAAAAEAAAEAAEKAAKAAAAIAPVAGAGVELRPVVTPVQPAVGAVAVASGTTVNALGDIVTADDAGDNNG